jgi:thiol:disulfide interchange protein
MGGMTRRSWIALATAPAWTQETTPKAAAGKYDPKANPEEDLRKAVRQATREGKHILMEVGGEWCSWCHRMEAFFERSTTLKEFRDKNYVLLRVNFSEENENKSFLSKYPPIDGYPFLFVLDGAGKFLHAQSTAVLEEGKTYDLERVSEFLRQYAPKKSGR